MTIVETTITLNTKSDRIKRIMKKGQKERLARSILDIGEIADSNLIAADVKIAAIKRLIESMYW